MVTDVVDRSGLTCLRSGGGVNRRRRTGRLDRAIVSGRGVGAVREVLVLMSGMRVRLEGCMDVRVGVRVGVRTEIAGRGG